MLGNEFANHHRLPCAVWPGLYETTTMTGTHNVTKLKGVVSKIMPCMCVIHFGKFLCLCLQNNNVKWPNSRFYGEREHTDDEFSCLGTFPTNSTRETFGRHWTSRNAFGIINNFERLDMSSLFRVLFSGFTLGVVPQWFVRGWLCFAGNLLYFLLFTSIFHPHVLLEAEGA